MTRTDTRLFRRLRLYDSLISWGAGLSMELLLGFFIVVIGEAIYGW